MIIAGPNGAGKSTLLDLLRKEGAPKDRRKDVLYIGPHRSARHQTVLERNLYQQPFSMSQLLASQSLPGIDGVEGGKNRDPWNHDDTANYLKHAICRVASRYERAIARRYREVGEIPRNSIPDPWVPFREVTSRLLPHLCFAGVEPNPKNPEVLGCNWTVHGTNVDLNQLSSGEKSIIHMFYPLVEPEIDALLGGAEGGGGTQRCVLIDEPELHLHPNLQVKVIEEFRAIASAGRVQLILATHSPTVVDAAYSSELFVLRPPESIASGTNQLQQIASDDEKLTWIRSIFGGASNLTAMQTVLVVEGVGPESKTVSDRQLYRALHPRFSEVTIISGGGHSQCRQLRDSLAEVLSHLAPNLAAWALLDRDIAAVNTNWVRHLEVSMIENLALDPRCIYDACEPVRERIGLRSDAEVEAALDLLLDQARDEEVERRVLDSAGYQKFNPTGPLAKLSNSFSEWCQAVGENFTEERVALMIQEQTRIVDTFVSQKRRRENFHGKRMLKRFCQERLRGTPLAYDLFVYYAIRAAGSRKGVRAFFDAFFDEILGPGSSLESDDA